MKGQKGITLIALVITIIVLLILVGVSISMVVGQNGVLSNAQNAVIANAKAKEEEGVKRSALAAISISSSKGNISLENGYLNQELKNEFGEGNYLLEETVDGFKVTILETGNMYELDKNGNLLGQVPQGGGAGENGGEDGNVSDDGYEGIYPDADTQPTDTTIFTYEIISETAKTIAITGIKSEYKSTYYYNLQASSYTIPEDRQTELVIPYEIDGYSVKEIKYLTYQGDNYNRLNTIASIELPKGLKIIGEEAFSYCYGLTNISIPNTVTTIENSAFYGCKALTNITIPDSITTIGEEAFSYSGLTSVTIPASINTIGDLAFEWCNNLTNVEILNGVTSIGRYAFSRCDMTSVTIPNSVTTIGDGVFSGCSNLTNIEVNAGNSAYIAVDGVLYNKDKTKIMCYPIKKEGAEYAILDGVITIGESAFRNCSSLTSVIIPDSVTTIGDSAFYNCSSLTDVAIPDSVSFIGGWAFDNCYKLNNIVIGKGVTKIGTAAFQNGNLKTVNYRGTQEEWDAITIEDFNRSLTNATVVPNYIGE